ncbi:MAG TPA: HAD-IIIA family hydrolase [Acidimicrobiales bacterium]|nr:HAD-IIIA family hydrolase [Acidimicrobiales bacterium]
MVRSAPRSAVFLDLSGTLVEPVQVERLSELEVLPSAAEAVALLAAAGFILPVVTTQSRIGRYFSGDEFERWFDELRSSHLPGLSTLYVCPHRLLAGCRCHKPSTELFERAVLDLDIDAASSYMVGDSGSDIEAGVRMGLTTCLVMTGWGPQNSEADRTKAHLVCADVLEAAKWISGRKEGTRSGP